MAVSYAQVNPGNFELTPCKVEVWDGAAWVDIGGTLGNVSIKIETDVAELKADQSGTTVVDRRVSGHKMSAEFNLAETQVKDNWKLVFPMHKKIVESGQEVIFFDSAVGQSQYALAKKWRFHPLSRPETDRSGDVIFFKATAEGKAEYNFSPTEQQQLKMSLHVYPDVSVIPYRFMMFGSELIGLQDAVHGSAVAASGNVGNGTVTGITMSNGYEFTETLTMTCVGAVTNAGNFSVVGSQSGPRGVAVVGAPFTAVPSDIGFTINDGSTDFAVGDQFTIAITGANYA